MHGGLALDRRDKIIRYDIHARQRMNQRGISAEQVEKVVMEPDVRRPARRADATRFENRFSAGSRLGVIAAEREREIRIITAFWI